MFIVPVRLGGLGNSCFPPFCALFRRHMIFAKSQRLILTLRNCRCCSTSSGEMVRCIYDSVRKSIYGGHGTATLPFLYTASLRHQFSQSITYRKPRLLSPSGRPQPTTPICRPRLDHFSIFTIACHLRAVVEEQLTAKIMSAASLSGLPMEILFEIFRHLPSSRELAALRLTAKRFHVIGIDLLIRKFSFVPSEGSTKRLAEVLKDPVLRERIEIFDYEVDLLPYHGQDVDKWRGENSKSPRGIPDHPLLGASLVERSTAWQAYLRAHAWQQAIPRDPQERRAILKSYLLRLPNVTTLFLSGYPGWGHPWTLHASQKYLSGTWTTPAWKKLASRASNQLLDLVMAAVEIDRPVTRLDVDHAPWSFFLDLAHDRANILPSIQGFVTHLKHVSMNIYMPLYSNMRDYPADPPGIRTISRREPLMSFLSSASSLESLSLSFQMPSCSCTHGHEDYRNYLLEEFAGANWPQLRVLHLTRVRMTVEHLISFLERYVGIIKILRLTEFDLVEGEWEDVIPVIEAMSLDVGSRVFITCSLHTVFT